MEILRSALEYVNMNIKGKIYWIKPNPVPQMADHKFTEAVEEMWFATKNEGLGHHFNTNKKQRTNAIKESNISSTFKNGGEIVDHPTQKPKRVMKPIIEYHTYKNDIILDPFVGSGTTCVVSQNMDREWIGIEKEEKYVNIAENRIRKETDVGQKSALSW